MKCDRTTPQRHWTQVGVRCKFLGMPVESALTGNETIDGWIRTGFDAASQSKSMLKRLAAQHGVTKEAE